MFQTKIFATQFHFFFYILQALLILVTKETGAIQSEKKTGCDEYVGDHLNVARKNLAKYVFVEQIGKNVWKIFASGRANLRKNAS